MKKLFFFKSFSSNGDNGDSPSPSASKHVFRESTMESGFDDQHGGNKAAYSFHSPECLFGESRKQMSRSLSFSNGSCLRRSHSFSSALFLIDDQNKSPNVAQHQQWMARDPEKKSKTKRCEGVDIGFERPCSSGLHHGTSGSSFSCSSNVSSKVINHYIDGEQQQEHCECTDCSKRNNIRNGDGRLPPRVRYAAPSSPTSGAEEKNMSDSVENRFQHESPRMMAKNVLERLSQNYALPRSSSEELYHHCPITTEDVYGGCLNRHPELSGQDDRHCFFASETVENTDVELRRRSKEAEDRVLFLSESLEQESFLRDGGFDVSSLIQTVRHLMEEEKNLTLEISDLLRSRIADRACTREGLRTARSEFKSQTKKIESEKQEIQLSLENELVRRSCAWSLKLKKYQSEEQRLRERARDLAEHNVSLQREVSSFNVKETENRISMTHSAERLKSLSTKVEEMNNENEELQQNLYLSRENYQAALEYRDCARRSFEEKDKECKELQKSVTRLLRTCSEQEKTIEGSRERNIEKINKKQYSEKKENQVKKLQMEQMRLTGVELALRRELTSCRLEIDSLRKENIDLSNHLNGNSNNIGSLTFKLDKEIQDYVCCLQDQGLSMLNDSSNLSSKLIEFIKGKASHSQLQETQQGLDSHGQFLIESNMKVRDFKRRIQSLTRNLQTISTLLDEKSSSAASNSHLTCMDPDVSAKLSNQYSEEPIRTELKTERLITSLLREKLYSKELEVEQLQAEISAAVRGNGILRSVLQNAMDNISCLTHRLNDLELQILKKDEIGTGLQDDLQESTKELTILRGILPKVCQERDLMWEEVMQYNEKNLVLNSEVNALKKKIEGLDEDILLKEGQITILKNTLNNHNFDLLSTVDSISEFLLQ